MRVGEWRVGRGKGIVEEARGMIGQRRERGAREGVGYMRGLGRRGKESRAEGCGVERRDAMVV